MSSEGGACHECSRNCLMLHHKHDSSQKISSFFKVMFGKNFSDLLILPPRFVKFNSLVDQKTYLENSSGQQWNVVLSTVNSSLAFQKGWCEFILDNAIEVGDFVVFHYITRSYFLVQIYGKSGCEKLNFSMESTRKNKRAKTTRDSVVLTPPRDSFFETSASKPGKNPCAVAQRDSDVTERRNDPNPSRKNDPEMSEVMPRTGFSEDSYLMFSKDTSSAHKDDRAHLFDLSMFERPDINARRMQLEMQGCSENGAIRCRITEANNFDCSKRIKRLSDEENSCPFTSHPSVNNNKPLWAYLSEMPSGKPPESDITAASGGGMVDIKKFSQELHRNPAAETSVDEPRHRAKPTIILPEVEINTRKVDDIFNHHVVKDEDEGETVMKQELTDICNNSLSLAVKVTCSVKPDSECFLELPEKLPLKVPRRGGDFEKKVVYLRDQVGRLWPVVYHQKNGVFVLTSGWKSYRKTNDIRPGDKCTFVVDGINDSVFGIQILGR